MADDPFAGARGGSLAVRDTTNLADILERILDKGIVVAGDIAISLVDVELLTIKVRLLIASADKAREMGIDWWEHDSFLTSGARDEVQAGRDGELSQRLDRIERAIEQLGSRTGADDQ